MKIHQSIYVEASLGEPANDISIWLKELVSALDASLVQRHLVKGYTLWARDEECGREETSLIDEQPPTYEESWGDVKPRSAKRSNRKMILSCVPAKDLAEKDLQYELSVILGRKMDDFQTGKFKDKSTASQKVSKDGWMSELNVTSVLTYMYGRYYMRRIVGELKEAEGEYLLSLLPKSDEEVENLSREGKCGRSLKEMLDEYF